jgi:hypothetical protein
LQVALRAELRILAALSSLWWLTGCASTDDAAEPSADPPAGSLLSEPLAELPQKLSEVGLYRDLSRLSASKRALHYEPGYPLWSDGGAKQRFLVLPEGTGIESGDSDYELPIGSLLFKTFAYRTEQSPEAPVPIETRLLRRTESGWELAAYGWDPTGSDATLLDLKKPRPVSVLADDGTPLEHDIPSRLECRQCHESAPSPVLGFTELQLAASGDLEQLAPHFESPPSEPSAQLPAQGPLTRAVLGYLVGNCVHCHNGSDGAAASFDLRPEVALQNLIDQPTASSATAAGIRVVPGEPDESILYLAVAGSTNVEVKDMPPLGVALRDASAVELLRDWIEALGAEEDP